MDQNSAQPIKTRPSDGDTPAIATPELEAKASQSSGVAKPEPVTTAPVTPVDAPVTDTTSATPTTGSDETTTPASTPPLLKKEGKDTPAPDVKPAAKTDSTPSQLPLREGGEPKELTIEERLEAARLAMEGPDRSAGRIKRQTEAKVDEETAELNDEKAELDKKKEKLELAWIDLDQKRGILKKELDPILAEEEKIEDEDRAAETEEEAAGLPTQKQAAEKKRQEKDVARKAVEEKKWVVQNKIIKLERQIDENTKLYQALLDEEEKILTKIEELKKELI